MSKRYLARIVGLCLAITCCGMPQNIVACWQNKTGYPAQDTAQIIPSITVNARRIPRNMTSSSPEQTLEKDEMTRMGALDVADAVRHFSGVSVKDYGGIGGLKTISVRSMGAQHTGVSYDGIAVGDCQSGQIDISRFSLANISKLTMTIGQSDNIYQSARMFASAGVLHIETTPPDFSNGTSHLNANIRTGSYGLANPSLLYSQQIGKKHSIMLYGDFLRADGNYPFILQNGQAVIEGKRNNSDIRTYRAEISYHAAFTPKQTLKVKTYLFDSERGLPGSIVYDNPYAAERLHDKNYFGQFSYENRFTQRLKLNVSGKYNYSYTRDTNKQASGDTDDRYRQTETYLSAILWGEPVQGLQISLSQDIIYNYLSSNLKKCQYPKRYTSLSVLAAHYRYKNLSLTASLLNTFITETVKYGKAAPNRQRLSPAASLTWKPFRHIGLRLRASYKDIFRNPTFNDLYYLIIGNSNLKPESTRQGNLGLTWSEDFSSPLEYISFTADVYYNKVKDKIVAIPTMFIWKMSNIGEVETIGTDINLNTAIRPTEYIKLYIDGSYNFMQAQDVTSPDGKTYKQQIAYTPRHSGSGTGTIETPWFCITYNLLFTSERFTKTQNTPDNRIRPYIDHSLSLFRIFNFGKHRLHIQADALNLTNKNYEVIRFYPMPGRNYKLTINYQI